MSTYERREILLRQADAADRVLHQQIASGAADHSRLVAVQPGGGAR
ncbi:hypothetical protein ACFC1R_34685 [Kitasatospora sp. NPDC056138]